MTETNLKAVAERRCFDPMSSWPDHSSGHRITLLGARLFDYDCLRCWLERTASERANAPTTTPACPTCGAMTKTLSPQWSPEHPFTFWCPRCGTATYLDTVYVPTMLSATNRPET